MVNTAADQLELSADQLERLNNLTPAAGERHESADGGHRSLTMRGRGAADGVAPGRARRSHLLSREAVAQTPRFSVRLQRENGP